MTALDMGVCIWFYMSVQGKIRHIGITTCQSVHETYTKIALAQCSFRTSKKENNTSKGFANEEITLFSNLIQCFISIV